MLESLGPKVACRDAEMSWWFALVLEFLLDGEGLVHGGCLERLGESVQLNIHLLDIGGSFLGSLFRLLLSNQVVLNLLLLHKGDLWVWLWLLLFCVCLGRIFNIRRSIDTRIERLAPNIITSG